MSVWRCDMDGCAGALRDCEMCEGFGVEDDAFGGASTCLACQGRCVVRICSSVVDAEISARPSKGEER